jgi:hypothetical protein
MKPMIRLASLTITLSLMACGTPQDPSTVSGNDAPSRVHATTVSFTKWHDTMMIDAAMVRDGDACKLLQPIVDDRTTKWKPFQIFWAIRDDASDVDLGTEIHDAFFVGDVTKASEFPGVLGFAALNPQYAHLLALESITVSPDGSTAEAKIGSPFNAKLRLQATPAGAGCQAGTTYCKTSGNCASESQYRPLSSILVKQNFLGYPTEVVYN